jgi:gamma-glutamylcyclotransferase (GGCT)/AIG2-like uncharacterized protein YtfP
MFLFTIDHSPFTIFAMQSEIYRLFVYGSLRSGLHNAIYTHISRYFVLDGMGAVQGDLYDLGEYPAAVHTTEESFITGEVYHIAQTDNFEWAMSVLDDYEGVDIALFRREPVHVLFQNTTIMAWIYWYNGVITDQTQIKSGDYVAYKMGIGK